MLPRANEVEEDSGNVSVSIRIPKTIDEQLDQICKDEYRTKSNAIVILLNEALESRKRGAE